MRPPTISQASVTPIRSDGPGKKQTTNLWRPPIAAPSGQEIHDRTLTEKDCPTDAHVRDAVGVDKLPEGGPRHSQLRREHLQHWAIGFATMGFREGGAGNAFQLPPNRCSDWRASSFQSARNRVPAYRRGRISAKWKRVSESLALTSGRNAPLQMAKVEEGPNLLRRSLEAGQS